MQNSAVSHVESVVVVGGFLHFLEALTRFQPRNVRTTRKKRVSVLERGRILFHGCSVCRLRCLMSSEDAFFTPNVDGATVT